MLRTMVTSILLAVAILFAPATALAENRSIPVPDGPSLTLESVKKMVVDVVNTFIVIAMTITIAMIVYGGFKMSTSGGDSAQFKAGKDTLVNAVIGLTVMLGVGIIINTIDDFAADPTSIVR